MIFNLLDDALSIVANVMHYILIGTIVLGSIFAIIFAIMIIKRIRYNHQIKHNKKQREKLIRNEPLEDEETP